jgi:subtilisin family serine protease
MRIRGFLLVLVLLAAVAAVPAAAGPSEGARWVRVQFADRITADDRAALAATGADALTYVPDHAYLAYADEDAARAAADVDGVTAVTPLAAADKVSDALAGVVGDVAVTVVSYGPAAASSEPRLARLGAVLDSAAAQADALLAATTVRVDAARLAEIAALPAVLAVSPAGTGLRPEDEGTAQVLAGNLKGGLPQPGYEAFLAAKGVSGEGVVLSIADTGIEARHPEFAGRDIKVFDYSADGPQEVDYGGHGTHVAGIVGGRGADLGAGLRARDTDGLLYGLGVAPNVTLIDQAVIARGSPFPPPSFEGYTRDAISAGAVGWNASWTSGEGAGAGYVARARDLDVLARDGDFDAPGNQPFVFVFSAGNSGGPRSRITGPKEAKNIVAVGSSRSHRGLVPTQAADVETISTFSSRGPAKDGRVLPTVVAPGENVISSRSFVGPSCSVPAADGLALYATCSGTSMASPHVAGSVALLTEWWRRGNDGATPSPAMVKALLVNTARDLGKPDVPNRDEGWGRVDLAALFADSAARVYVDQSVVLDELDEASTLRVTPADPSRPLRVTLVWTDAPGAPDAKRALVNDLDLVVESADGTQWRGNAFDDGLSEPGARADRIDNVENVFLPDAASEGYTVSVVAHNLPADGIPGAGTHTEQDFALVISNAVAAS